jgi:hypothetical protein
MTPQTLHTRRLWALPAMLAALSASAYAQTTATPATAAPTEDSEKAPVKLEEVRVLGSRIRLT